MPNFASGAKLIVRLSSLRACDGIVTAIYITALIVHNAAYRSI